VAAACRRPDASAGAESTRLTLAIGNELTFVPHMVAIEKRWLRDAGFVEVVTRTFSDESNAREALLAGELSLWTAGNLPPVTMVHSGVPVVVLGTNAITTITADKLVGPKDANPRAPEDPYRVRIGQMAHTRSLFVASEAFVRKSPIAARQMISALVKAQRYAADPKNRDEVIDIFSRGTRQEKTVATAVWDEYVFDPTISQAYVDDMKAITDYLVASGGIKGPRDPLDYTYSDPLAAADPALVKVSGRFKP
jgi:ABC-type nitrate/sulfonate/bicarbonate transport system substrate-binding protein